MKQISQNYKTGAIRLDEVNEPALRPGGLLVESRYSVISTGTEGMKVREGKMSYLEKARARPDQVRKVVQSVQQQGLRPTFHKVMTKLDSLTPLGYSAAGLVKAVGPGAEAFAVGQRVACAGAGYANHAQVNFVPKNLVAPVPDNVSLKHAAFATIGAIALQGYRQAEMQLGETACVIGLGLLGQLLVQILRAAGMHVIGVDLLDSRCRLALELGAAAAGTPADTGLRAATRRLTAGFGVDCVFIAAGGAGNGPVEYAVEVARDRARVIDIGKTKLDLPWKDYYEKELEVRFSRSYGPGRYDPNYEERGIDYPIGYVRWTEQRNMASFLNLIADGKVDLDPIITAVYPLAEVETVYHAISAGPNGHLGVVFEYPSRNDAQPGTLSPPILQSFGFAQDRSSNPPILHPQRNGLEPVPVSLPNRNSEAGFLAANPVRLGVIGAGSYASSMLLPHLHNHAAVRLVEVATATGLSGANAARKFNFERTSTAYQSLLAAPDIDAVLIATRHSAHAAMTAAALRSGKAVFVEKPLALDRAGLEQVRQALSEADNDRLLVGFNRRFSPLVKTIAAVFSDPGLPLVMHYRVHAGQMEPNAWYLDPSEGSRFVGEAGHFIDVLAAICQSRPVSVWATSLRPRPATRDDLENMAVVINYENGSVGHLLYLTQGGLKVPKEYLEIFGGGTAAQLHNFESVTFYEGNRKRTVRSKLDKGQKDEMEAFITAIRSGQPMPISTDSLFDTTLATLAAIDSITTGRPVALADYWQRTGLC